ncbi:MAG TPA: DUF3775 domain-containing protein [Rhizomicrobium sp.]|jgi:hypothetical protein
MLQHLKQTDIDAIIAACEAASPQSQPGSAVPAEISLADRDRIYGLVEALPREAQDELLALMWTGGPKNASTFEENLELAQKTAEDNHSIHLAEQGANLPDYLREGLKRMAAR